jgi:PDZ domain-containing protein
VIVRFDGRTVATASDLGEAVLTRKPGDTVEVVVQRDESRETLDVTLGTRPDRAQTG